jgi:hypothetical protein
MILATEFTRKERRNVNDDLSDQRIGKILLERYRLRTQPEMRQYLLDQLRARANADAPIPVIGGNARTGVAVRQLIAASELQAAMRVAIPA